MTPEELGKQFRESEKQRRERRKQFNLQQFQLMQEAIKAGAEEREKERELALKIISIGYRELAKEFPANGPTVRTLKEIRSKLKRYFQP
jgi:hypothetical protein